MEEVLAYLIFILKIHKSNCFFKIDLKVLFIYNIKKQKEMELMTALFSLERNYTHECSYIFFIQKGHAELAIDEKMYNLVCKGKPRYIHPLTVDAIGNRAIYRNSPSEHLRIRLGLTEYEYTEIQNALDRKSLSFSTCSGSISDLLNRVTKSALPKLESLSPTGLAVYFWDTKENQSSRVQCIEYYGQSECEVKDGTLLINKKSLSSMFETEILIIFASLAAAILFSLLLWVRFVVLKDSTTMD